MFEILEEMANDQVEVIKKEIHRLNEDPMLLDKLSEQVDKRKAFQEFINQLIYVKNLWAKLGIEEKKNIELSELINITQKNEHFYIQVKKKPTSEEIKYVQRISYEKFWGMANILLELIGQNQPDASTYIKMTC